MSLLVAAPPAHKSWIVSGRRLDKQFSAVSGFKELDDIVQIDAVFDCSAATTA